MDRQRRVAFHEAGHAIVAHELGLNVEWIELNEDGSGECRITNEGLGPIYAEACAYAAGSLAVWIKFNISEHPLSPNDVKGVRRVPREQQIRATDRAEQILRARWADVTALANRLLEDPDGYLPLPFPRDFSNS